jgi:flagellin
MAEGDTLTINLDIADQADVIAGGGQTFSGDVFTYTATGNTVVDNAAFINGLKEALQSIVVDYIVSSSGNEITFNARGIGDAYAGVTLTGAHDGTGAAEDEGTQTNEVTGDNAEIEITGTAADGSVVSETLDTSDATQFTNGVFRETTTTGLVFEIADLTRLGSTIVEVSAGRELTVQAGANTGRDQTIAIDVGLMSTAGLGINNLDVSTHLAAQGTLASVEAAITMVSTQRAELGAVQNRLEHTILNLDTVAENLQEAEARIRDVDMAKEMMTFTKFSILTQASQAMMAQANNLPQGVLQLLR